MIREGLLDSDRYWSVNIEARQLYVHMLLLADDFGCLEAGPHYLGRRCFGTDRPSPEKVAKLLSDLNDSDLVRLYEHAGKRYAHIPRFNQRMRSYKSRCPLPPDGVLDIDQNKIPDVTDQEWRGLRRAVFERDGHQCVLCKSTARLSVDHIWPRVKGGRSTLQNLATLCIYCNTQKGDDTSRSEEIQQLIEKMSAERGVAPTNARDTPLEEKRSRREVEVEVEEKRSREETARGTRLSPSWEPGEEGLAYCRRERPDLDPQRTFDAFRDYFLAAPGQKGVKRDWAATWRTWVRNEKRQQGATNASARFNLRESTERIVRAAGGVGSAAPGSVSGDVWGEVLPAIPDRTR